MKVLGHRPIRGPNLYRNGPVDYLVVRHAEADLGSAATQLGLQDTPTSLGDLVGATAAMLLAETELPAWRDTWTDEDGDHIIVHEMADPRTVQAAMTAAAELVGDAINQTLTADAVARAQAAVHEVFEDHDGDGSLRAIIQAARARGIPIDERSESHLQLGWGVQQKQMVGTITSTLSGLGFDIANDHERNKQFLSERGIPMPRADSARSLAGVQEIAHELGYPVALKPLRGKGGVTTDIKDDEALETAYDMAKKLHNWIVVEDHVPGPAFDILVIDGKVVAAQRKTDGADVTDTIHPAVRLVAERCARLTQTNLLAVDIIAESLQVPLDETNGKVVGLDPQPDIAKYPAARGAPDHVLDLLFPDGGTGRIPLAAVTGTNGKTTTIRLLSHIVKYSGGRVGMACTGAVEVENRVILEGDYSGPTAARTVLREPGVTHAICEVARGGLLRSGLGFDRCDVGVFLNVASDHLGQGGIQTVDDLARLKSVVIRAVSPDGTAVLNADDERVWATREGLACRVIPFSLDPNHSALAAHLAADPEHAAVTLHDGAIVLRRGAAQFEVAHIVDIPITLEGAATFNVQNAMAAVAAAYALGLSEEDTRAGLISFNPSFGQLPGRMNLLELGGVKVLLDYGHNVPALEALAKVLPRLATGRKLNVANGAGNRMDEHLRAFGATIAGMYDHIYLCDPDPRRRRTGETAAVIREGILDAGFAEESLSMIMDESRALRQALADSRPGDLVVLQADDVPAAIALCQGLQARLDAGETAEALNRELLVGS